MNMVSPKRGRQTEETNGMVFGPLANALESWRFSVGTCIMRSIVMLCALVE